MSFTAAILYFASVLFFALGWEAICFCIVFRKWAHEQLTHSTLYRISRAGSILFLALSALLAALLLFFIPSSTLAWLPIEALSLYALWKVARAFFSHNIDTNFILWTIILTASYLTLFIYIFIIYY